MTRINVVPPEELTDQHLLAEYRELPRVFRLARHVTGAPSAYTMGKGHVTFFYARTGFLARRQAALIAECLRRGFHVQHVEPPAPVEGLDEDWQPDAAALACNRRRLADRLGERPNFYTHCGRKVDATFYESGV